MKIKDYAAKIGRSEQFVRLACQQGQIKAIVISHPSGRHSYEILEENNNEKSNNDSPVGSIMHRDLHDIR